MGNTAARLSGKYQSYNFNNHHNNTTYNINKNNLKNDYQQTQSKLPPSSIEIDEYSRETNSEIDMNDDYYTNKSRFSMRVFLIKKNFIFNFKDLNSLSNGIKQVDVMY